MALCTGIHLRVAGSRTHSLVIINHRSVQDAVCFLRLEIANKLIDWKFEFSEDLLIFKLNESVEIRKATFAEMWSHEIFWRS